MTKHKTRKIILASRSKARAALLRQIGLRFRVAASAVKESRKLRGGCGELVIKNALLKAHDVAKRRRSGVVIAADTVVLVNGCIIGKPRDKKDAIRTLRLLSRVPQWVYSGIAVIDIDNSKLYTDSEKTRVYMRRLTDEEIEGYFRRVTPFDKAGGFDIQGLGAVFIGRIEGCYYNVVGLPLAKLAALLEKAGVKIL